MTELLGSCHTDEIPLTEEGAEAILFYADEFADALIAAGIGDIREAEHRAEVAERAGKIAASKVFDYTYEEAVAQAEKELAEELKNERL